MPRAKGGTDRADGIGRRTFLRASATLTGGAVVTDLAGGRRPPSENHEVHEGESIDVEDGTVEAYATTTAEGELSSLGVHLDGDALAAFDVESVAAHLSFPDAVDARQFTFMGFHYNPGGHPPPEIYTVPHFDFHFYMLDEEDVEAIPFGLAAYGVPDEQFPPGYVFEEPRLVIPGMGEHLLDGTAPEFNDEEFTHTYVYGTYDPKIDPEKPDDVEEMELEGENQEVPVYGGDGEGRLHFVEPMITTEFLTGLEAEQTVDVETPEAFFTADDYPTKYVMKPDDSGGVSVSIDGFEEFSGPSE